MNADGGRFEPPTNASRLSEETSEPCPISTGFRVRAVCSTVGAVMGRVFVVLYPSYTSTTLEYGSRYEPVASSTRYEEAA